MTETTAPFDAILGVYGIAYRSVNLGQVVRVVRETETTWVTEEGTRWRKKDRLEVGNAGSFIYDYRIIPPGHPDYSEEYVVTYKANGERDKFRDVAQKIVEADTMEGIAPHVRTLQAMLDEKEAQA